MLLIGGDDINLRASLATELSALGWQVSLLGSARPQEIPESVGDFHLYSLSRDFNIFADLKAIWQLRKILKNNRYDVVHAFDTKPGIFVPLAAIGTGQRIVRTITGLGRLFVENDLLSRTLRGVYGVCHKLVSRGVTTTIFYNQSDRDYFVDNGLTSAERAHIVPGSGIDLNRFSKSNFDEQQIEALRKQIGIREDLSLIHI